VDGEPIWQHGEWFAASQQRNSGPEDARLFIENLAIRLGVGTSTLLPGHEDAFYYMWRERCLPINVDPFESKLENEAERARLRRVFTQRLDRVVGYAMPLRAVESGDGGWRFETGSWFLRDERLYLLPGDSPMGFRLPLDSLPWQDVAQREVIIERDPFAAPAALPPHRIVAQQRLGCESQQVHAALGASASNVVRTALCVEPRQGIVHVFLPPVEALGPFTTAPWLADRLFRHLLADVTGNTHRCELCIDKLFSPDSPHGRQGLVELRSFEMQPDARTNLAQQLLVRAMVALFWQYPYRRPLQRWGTTLHDQGKRI
jgi:uncharacterized protein (DUF2126 family)